MTTIEIETPLVPSIIAELVTDEARTFATTLPPGLAESLAERAEKHFSQGGEFARKLRGRNGREHLYSFMRHWCAGVLVTTGTPRDSIPATWMNGQQLTR